MCVCVNIYLGLVFGFIFGIIYLFRFGEGGYCNFLGFAFRFLFFMFFCLVLFGFVD